MQFSKITFTSGLLVLALAMSGAAQSDSHKSEKGIINLHPDSFKSPSLKADSDTILVSGNCTPKMPTMNFSGPKPAEMPNMPIDKELTSNMPIMGQDSSCVEEELPEE